MMPEIVVVGSVNMDLVATLPRLPMLGETLAGLDFRTVPGGKGANQAYGAAKLGGDVAMVGCVGADGFGRESLANLRSVGVNTDRVRVAAETRSGVAVILVDEAANNTIVVVPGANALVSEEDVKDAAGLFTGARILLVQLEIPLPTVTAAMRLAKSQGVLVVLDPAPARPLPDEILALADYIAPNQTESEILTGIAVTDFASAARAGRALIGRGAGCALVKMGRDGVAIVDGLGVRHVPGHLVKAVDTTAAGDCFAAGLAVALSHGLDPDGSVAYGNAAAAVSVTRFGAQSSMPDADEVRALTGKVLP